MLCILAECLAREKRKRKMISSYKELQERLVFYIDDEYRSFTVRLISTERPILGVRIPKIRELVKEVSQEKIIEFLKKEPIAFEEVLARGFLIARLSYEEALEWFDSQIQYVSDWCTCDTFCSALKSIKKHKADFIDKKIRELLNSSDEFTTRTGLVFLKCYYVDFDYLNLVFELVEELADRKEYYVRMAIAWLIAECFIKFPTATIGFLISSKLPKWTYNKTISKICDSYRVDNEAKRLLREMRK